MSLPRRRMDRAQRTRARRVWWERHGAFMRGYIAGTLVTLLVLGAARLAGLL